VRLQRSAEPVETSREAPPSDEPPSSGEPPSPFCQRCGRLVDMAAIGPQVGLCHCPYCQSYACRWCWADASGDCPGCAFPYAVASTAAVAAQNRPATTRRWTLRAPLAVGAVVVAIALLVLSVGGLFPPTAGFEAGSASPTGVAIATTGLSAMGSPSGSPTGTAGALASPATDPAAISPLPTGTQAPAGGTAPPPSIPTPTPTPTPARTPRPTSAPTPLPTPRPTPPPVCRTVPVLVGLTVSSARAAWTRAGFTGSFDPAKGHDRMIVQTQSRTTGACLPAAATIAVTYSRTTS
jgi:hypothetical protein